MNLMGVKNDFCLLLAGVACVQHVKTNKMKFLVPRRYSEVFYSKYLSHVFLLTSAVVFKIIVYIYFVGYSTFFFYICYVIYSGC